MKNDNVNNQQRPAQGNAPYNAQYANNRPQGYQQNETHGYPQNGPQGFSQNRPQGYPQNPPGGFAQGKAPVNGVRPVNQPQPSPARPQQQYSQPSQRNDIPPATPPKTKQKSGGGKKAGIIIAVILALVLLIGVIVAAVLLITSQGNTPDKITKALADGRYSTAIELYDDKYGDGKTDNKLNEALIIRLCAIEDDYRDGKISYDAAKKEIEIIKEMNIPDIADDIEKTEEYVNNLIEGTTQEPVTDNDILPGKPVIASAVTLNGVVLAASNTNAARSFGPEKTHDGYYDSCWCVNTTSTGGAGASIRFNLQQKATVKGVKLVNGNLYMPEDDIFKSNGQVKTFTLTFSDGTRKTFTASYNSSASSAYETFTFDTPVNTDYIILTVDSGYAGAKYTTNVCIGEFAAF